MTLRKRLVSWVMARTFGYTAADVTTWRITCHEQARELELIASCMEDEENEHGEGTD